MARIEKPPAKPSFLWQGLLILLPVVVLAGAGFYSLREDRRLVRREAEEKARTLADEMVRVLWSELTDPANLQQFSNYTFRVDAEGHLVFPPPVPPLPEPVALDLTGLSEAQQRWWATAHDSSRGSEAIAACQQLLDANLPTNLAANVALRLAVLLEREGDWREAANIFQSVADRYPTATGESGVPLDPLARFRALELAARATNTPAVLRAGSLNALCSNLVTRPTVLSAALLSKAAAVEPALGVTNVVARWLEEWQQQEALRALASSALSECKVQDSDAHSAVQLTNAPAIPALFWFRASDLNAHQQPLNTPDKLRQIGLRFRSGRNDYSPDPFSITGGTVRAAEPARAPTIDRDNHPREWLASRLDDGRGGFLIACRAMGRVTRERIDLASARVGWDSILKKIPPMPDWLDFSFTVAGATLISTNDLAYVEYRGSGKGSGHSWQKVVSRFPPDILASAQKIEDGQETLRVNIHLVSPEMLFAAQQSRTRLFGLLIAVAAVVAVIGFVSAWRAFQREQRLSEMKTNFVSSVSHELRAPIASVRLMAEGLERGKVSDPAKQHEYFGFIVRECRRLSSLIANVLDFSRIEQGRKQYEFETTDLVAMVRETVKVMEPHAAEREVKIVAELPGACLHPSADGRALQQALVNLIDNAIKHSPAGETVTVGLECAPLECGDLSPLSSDATSRIAVGDKSPTGKSADQSAHSKDALVRPASGRDGFHSVPDLQQTNGDAVERVPTSIQQSSAQSEIVLYVTDHGPGIPPEEHEKIFERFYRLGSELRRETQGVGIGLSIVKHIVEAHGGCVKVQSEVGKGSRFAIELPATGATKGSHR